MYPKNSFWLLTPIRKSSHPYHIFEHHLQRRLHNLYILIMFGKTPFFGDKKSKKKVTFPTKGLEETRMRSPSHLEATPNNGKKHVDDDDDLLRSPISGVARYEQQQREQAIPKTNSNPTDATTSTTAAATTPTTTPTIQMTSAQQSHQQQHQQHTQQQGLSTTPRLNDRMYLLPHQNVIQVVCKTFHSIFVFPHVFLHLFMLALTIYIMYLSSPEGFTIFITFNSVLQILSTFVGVSSTGRKNTTEPLLQIYAVALGLALLFQLACTIIYITAWHSLIAHMKNQYLEELHKDNAQNAFIVLYDFLAGFQGIFVALHVLDLIGMVVTLVCVKVQIANLYKELLWPEEDGKRQFSIALIKTSWARRNDSKYIDELLKLQNSPSTGNQPNTQGAAAENNGRRHSSSLSVSNSKNVIAAQP